MNDEPFDERVEDGYVRGRVPMYAMLYPILRECAREHGYALLLHGSLARDLDVVAVPWTKDPTNPVLLAKALAERIGADIGELSKRLHRRLSIPILLDAWPPDGPVEHAAPAGYVDLSIIEPWHDEEE